MSRVLSALQRFLKVRRVYGLKLLVAMFIITIPDLLLSSFLSSYDVLSQAVLGEKVNEGVTFAPDPVDWIFWGGLALLWLIGLQRALRVVALIYTGWVTLLLFGDIILLVISIFLPAQRGTNLLKDGFLVWLSNVLLFSMWYWLLDGGGAETRRLNPVARRDLAFPLQTGAYPDWQRWQPHFLDYLFIAFLASTNFAPADVIVLSRRAKCLMMLQIAFSLVIIAVLAARAINLLR